VSANTNVERNLVFTNPVAASSFRVIGQDSPLRIRELALYPPNGPSGWPLGTDLTINLAYQRPTTASANTAGNFALNAVDGRASAFMWQTGAAGTNTLDIDLRVSTKIGSAHLYSGSTAVSPLADFVLKYWDGTAWQNIAGGTVAGNATSDLVVPFTTPVTTTKVRLEFTNPGTTSIRELCIFPANTGNIGYPIGTNLIGSGAIAQYEDYNDAFYQIVNPSSSRFIAVAGGQPTLDQAGLTTGQGQYQVLLNISTGTYRLRNRATGNCLSGAQLSKTPGAPLADAPYSALPHQDWILDPLGGGNFQLINPWSGLAIDTQGGATAAGTALVQNTANGSATQRWRFSYSIWHPKKGAGGTSFGTKLDIEWAYNWGQKNNNILPSGAVYHPMQWGDYNWTIGSNAGPLWQYYPTWRDSAEGLHLLGFNEPDAFEQSGKDLDPTNPQIKENFSWERSMAEAVMLWPRLQALDLPLVSPAPANMTGGWLASFYTEAANLGYRVDYTAIHTYPSPNAGSSDELISTIQSAYATWNRPVWLTEFSFVNWSGTGIWTEEDNYNCLAEFLWRAESVSSLRKYALFVFTEDASSPAPAQPWSTVGPRSNSYDINGKLTPFGELYAAWDNDASVGTNKVYYLHNRNARKRLANTLASTANARSIRTADTSVKWTLVPTPTSNQYYVVSARDGRRLSYINSGAVSLVAAGTTGTAVQWSLTEDQHGWFYLGHPATSKRLQLAYNNTSGVATYTMAANTNTGDAGKWRFIVPPPPPVWSGAGDASWTNAGNWSPGVVPAAGDSVTFNSSSTVNLGTVLNQDFNLLGMMVTDPAGPVSIAGTHSLTVGANGIDLSVSSQNLAIAAPVVLSAAQGWTVAANRTLGVNGGLAGAFPVTVVGAVSLGGPMGPSVAMTVAAGGTLKTGASAVLSNDPTAVDLMLLGALDLNGTSQSVKFLSGSGIIDNTAAGAAVLTVGNNDAGGTLSHLFQNTNGTLALIKTGAGNLTLPAANTFSGGFTNNGTGNVYPQNDAALGTGPVFFNAGQIYPTATVTFANPLTLNGSTLRIGGAGGKTITWNGPVTATGISGLSADNGTAGITLGNTLNIAGASFSSIANATTNTIAGAITGIGGSLNVTGGTLALGGANDYTGATTLSAAGTLRLQASATISSSSNVTISGAGNFVVRNTLGWVYHGSISGDGTGQINLNTGTNATLAGDISGVLNINANSAGTDAIISGDISGGANVTVQGTVDVNGLGAILRLGGSNSYTGSTTVSRGSLVLAASDVLPDATPVSIGNATLNAATFTDTAGTLDVTSTATIALGTGAALAFADSSAVAWTEGTLAITGTFVPGVSLRFGTASSGLTSTQLGLISVAGFGPFALNPDGFLTVVTASGYDTWKTQITNGLNLRTDDADGDGFTNLQEFLFGTSPIAGNGSLVSTTVGNGNLVLRWLQRESGASYTLQQSSTLAVGSWTAVISPSPALDGDQTGAPTDSDYHTLTLPTGGGQSFFRVDGMEN
jgi:autotransporter-associated beta strand protein